MRVARLLLIASLALSGCPDAEDVSSPADAAPQDALIVDAAPPADAAMEDAEVQVDAAPVVDAAPRDMDLPDAAPAELDAGLADAAVGGPCEPPLTIEPGVAFARAFDLVTFQASGGTGDWRFELVEDASGALLNAETGAYLAGEAVGATDVVRLYDLGCEGEARASVAVVEPMQVAPTDVEVTAGATFTFEVLGGSGRARFEMVMAGSGGEVADDGRYVAGEALGQDRVRVTDVGTDQIVDVRVEVVESVRLVPDPPEVFLSLGARMPLAIRGGSGSFVVETAGDTVAVEGQMLVAVRPGETRLMIRDRFLDLETVMRATAVEGLRAPLTRNGDASSWTSPHAPGDLDGDGFADAIIGLGEADVGWVNAGAVYIYHGGPEGLGPEPAQVLFGDSRHEQFGRSVDTGDVDGDGRIDLIVGAYLADEGFNDTGAVRVFAGVEGGLFDPDPIAVLNAPRGGDQSGTGTALCDFNGDGRLDIALGAWLYEDRDLGGAATNQGGVLVFLGYEDGFLQRPDNVLVGMLPGEDGELAPAADLRIGWTLAAGDVDGDGLCDLAAGTTQYRGQSPGDGAVLIYKGVAPDELGEGGLTPLPVEVILPTDPESVTGNFGRRIAMGDIDGDARADLLVGRHAHDAPPGANHGQALLYLGRALSADPAFEATAAEAADWQYTGDNPNDNMGIGIAMGDVDGDGLDDAVVGGWFDEIVGEPGSTGTLRVFSGVRDGLPGAEADRVIRIPNPQETAGRLFGESLAVLGDVDGGGAVDVLGMASRDDTLGDDVGQPFVFPGEDVETAYALGFPGGIGGQRFGQGVAFVGDVTGDGRPDAIAAAPFQGFVASGRTGRAWLFPGEEGGLAREPAMAFDGFPNHSGFDLFGYGVFPVGDFDGDGVRDFAITARDEEPPTDLGNDAIYLRDGECPVRRFNHGAVYVFRGGADGLPAARPSWVLYGPEQNAMFNQAAAADVNGDGLDDLIVGSLFWDGRANDAGGVQVFLGRPPADGDRIRALCDPVFTMRGDAPSQHMGRSVIGLGDVDGDGCEEVAFGTARDSIDGLNVQGSVRVIFGWAGPGCPAAPELVVMAPGQGAAEAGYALASSDLDGDRVPDLVVGMPNFVVDGQRQGAVAVVPGSYIAELPRRPAERTRVNAEGLSPRGAVFLAEGRFPGERFGTAVGAVGQVIVVGSPFGAYTGVAQVGGARIYAVTGRGVDPDPIAAFVGQTERPGGRIGEYLHAARVGGQVGVIIGGHDADGVEVEGAETVDPGGAFGFFFTP